ncbi:hypothetical protein DL96DRAFT_1819845 [Flagelloscypha sp. PMI_526]|nr:hypothetical protein DL96DRAFT_1819845 [Flagelloscypha sp. PMI_526]
MNSEDLSTSTSDPQIEGDKMPALPIPANTSMPNDPLKAAQPPRKIMGITQYQPNYTSGRNFNYDSKYPEDMPGEEASENARVWMIYNDEAEIYDDGMLSGFRDTIDSLLVFAALFSAVVTTFIIQTSTFLQPDHAKITSYLLAEQILLLRANGNITAINAVPFSLLSPGTIRHSKSDTAINVLFFVSLALSLSTALFCILVKQWLTSYATKVAGTPKFVALVRHFRFSGIQKWKFPQFVGILPFLLHISLWMFSCGLLIFVWNLNLAVFGATVSVLGVTGIIYAIFLLVPPFFVDCPYHIDLVDVPIRFIFLGIATILLSVWNWATLSVNRRLRAWFPGSFFIPRSRPAIPMHFWDLRRSWERDAAEEPRNLCASVVWLYDYSSNSSIRNAAAKSFAGILPIGGELQGQDHRYYYDKRIIKTLVHRDDIILTLWEIAATSGSASTLPKSSDQLHMAILPSSHTYNPVVRAELALHSWSYFWLQDESLSRDDYNPSLKSRAHRLVGLCYHSKNTRPDFIEYIVNCNDIWEPASRSWSIHPLHWHGAADSMQPLNMIATIGVTELVQPVSTKVDLNTLPDDRPTLVNLAIEHYRNDTLKAFVAAGADLTLRGPDTSLQRACNVRNMDAVRFLLEQPGVVENIGMEERMEDSPFYSALHADGSEELVKLLIDKGVQIPFELQGELRTLIDSKGEGGREFLEIFDQAWGSPLPTDDCP